MKWNYCFIALIFCSVLLCSCKEKSSVQTPTPNEDSINTQVVTLDEIELTETLVFTPTIKTSGNTATPSPDATVTSVSIDGYDYIIEHELGGNKCLLPCWWGIDIGSSFEDAVKTIEPLYKSGYSVLDDSNLAIKHVKPDNCQGVGLEEDGLKFRNLICKNVSEEVDFIYTTYIGYSDAQKLQFLSPGYFMDTYGVPDDIWLDIRPDTGVTYTTSLTFFYENDQVIISFLGLYKTSNGGTELLICPNEVNLETGLGPQSVSFYIADEVYYPQIVDSFISEKAKNLSTGVYIDGLTKFSYDEIINSILHDQSDHNDCLRVALER